MVPREVAKYRAAVSAASVSEMSICQSAEREFYDRSSFIRSTAAKCDVLPK